MATLQTLDRGIQALFVVAARRDGISVPDLADELGVPRATAYRIVTTLISHGLLRRADSGLLHLGAVLPALAGQYWPGFLGMAQPILQRLADESGATSFISIAEGDDCVVLMTAEPTIPILRVGYRAGSRHPLSMGAAGLAILAMRPPTLNEPVELSEVRRIGYSVTQGQLQRGAVGIAAGVSHSKNTSMGFEASVGIVALEGFDIQANTPLVKSAAEAIARLTEGLD